MVNEVLRVAKRNQNVKRQRNRFLVILMLPALILIWLVGWSMYWIGHQKTEKATLKPKSQTANITLIAAPSIDLNAENEELEVTI